MSPEEHAEEVKALVRDCMIAVKKYVLSVPMVVQSKVSSRREK
ncbi:hypothetical protein [Polyangium aurulentum]|nr:hypothetical protein [Polyangium aurulentum]